MRKYSIDTLLRVRLNHQPGQLARLASAIAEEGGLLGEISTERINERDTVRIIAVESEDEHHASRVIARARKTQGVEILDVVDRVFDRHRGGKIHMQPRLPLNSVRDLRDIYTPGVARVSRAIEAVPERAWELTAMGQTVAIYSNGTRVLGLGDIGPLASLPVMEGKSVLYSAFAGLSAVPIVLDARDPEHFIDTVVRTSVGFGAIHLEDIRTPDCYRIEDELKRLLHKPVMHDDQHGTAVAALAGLVNACRSTGRDPKKSVMGQIGLGAAGSAIAKLAHRWGVGQVLVTDMNVEAVESAAAWGAQRSSLKQIMAECDIVIATTGRPGLITREMVRPGQIIFALSNPDPEIRPAEAIEAGAAYAGDGRSVNNALAFPGIFKGALDVRSRSITPEMLLAAVEAIAKSADHGEIVPSPLDPRVHKAVTHAVAATAIEQGLANTARAQ